MKEIVINKLKELIDRLSSGDYLAINDLLIIGTSISNLVSESTLKFVGYILSFASIGLNDALFLHIYRSTIPTILTPQEKIEDMFKKDIQQVIEALKNLEKAIEENNYKSLIENSVKILDIAMKYTHIMKALKPPIPTTTTE